MGAAACDRSPMGVKPTREEVIAWVEHSCAAQGVPLKISDPLVVERVAALLGQVRQTASTRPGSKLDRPRTAGRMVARSRTAATIDR